MSLFLLRDQMAEKQKPQIEFRYFTITHTDASDNKISINYGKKTGILFCFVKCKVVKEYKMFYRALIHKTFLNNKNPAYRRH